MTDLENKMLNALVNYGAALDGWKVKILSVSGSGDVAEVELLVTKKRCRKPLIWWKIPVDMARGLAYFDRAEHKYL